MSPFRAQTARPISTKFCTDLPTNSGKVLNASMTPPTQPLDPRVPQTPKPKRVTGEKTLCNVKCPDGWRKLIKFFSGSAGARLACSQYISSLIKNQASSLITYYLFKFHHCVQSKAERDMGYISWVSK